MRPLRVLLLLGLLAGLLPPAAAAAAARTPLLVAVRAAAHPGFDRVVWQFDGPLPERVLVRRSAVLRADGSGDPVRIAGRSVLVVTMIGADAHDSAGRPTAPGRFAPGLPNAVEVVRSGDFEAVVTYGVGVVSDTRYRLSRLTSPSRVVLDVDHAARQSPVRVFFQDRPAYAAGRQPDTVPVRRSVPATSPASAALWHLFAGPTPAEQRRGLIAVRSGATGFRDLSVRDGIARVRLTGGCSSGGSTYTVADLIVPTLRQLSTVDVVKIYDPQGRTARPTGRSDSRPACLEP